MGISQDYSEKLRSLMRQVNISSFRALAQQAGVSVWQIRQLRHGQILRMRLEMVQRISHLLQLPLGEVMTQFSPSDNGPYPLSEGSVTPTSNSAATIGSASESGTPAERTPADELQQELKRLRQEVTTLQREYGRSQTHLAEQRQILQQEFQRTGIDILESWMVYWPAAAFAVEKNPSFPATRLLPLVRSIEQLLAQWGVEAIAPVGATVPYNPHTHQLIKGSANLDDPVQIRNPGYIHNGALLYRAKVEGKTEG